MDRRDFLKTCVAAGVGIGLSSVAGGLPIIGRAGAQDSAGGPPDMVAVRNGEPDVMFDHGIAAMGGMGRFVRPGSRVTIKPNISWDTSIEQAGNTNPVLIHRIIRQCQEAGASRVTVFDHSIEFWQSSLDNSGIGHAVQDTKAVFAPADAERYYQRTAVNGEVLRDALVHEAIFDCDVLISVPILKHHGGTGMTASLKNFMGAVWDRRFFHSRGLDQCIADFMLIRKPDLTVIDAYRILTNNGPRSRMPQDVRLTKMQILSTDIVAADAAAARLLGKEPSQFGHITRAHAMGFGEIDPARLAVRRISL